MITWSQWHNYKYSISSYCIKQGHTPFTLSSTKEISLSSPFLDLTTATENTEITCNEQYRKGSSFLTVSRLTWKWGELAVLRLEFKQCEFWYYSSRPQTAWYKACVTIQTFKYLWTCVYVSMCTHACVRKT